LRKEILEKKYAKLTNGEYLKTLNDDFDKALEEEYRIKKRKGLNIDR
jgi:hypothetical protein